MTQARRPAQPVRSDAAGPLTLTLSCQKCGGPFDVDDETVTLKCPHCASLLLIEAPERDEVFVGNGTIRGPEDVLEIVILYRVEAYRSELRGLSADEEGNPGVDPFLESQVAAYAARLRRSGQVLEAFRLHVPYWHITGAIVQGILGRRGGGKLVRVRSFAVEHSVPAYDAARGNFRDDGLRLCRARVQPLVTRELAARAPFLPWVPVPDQTYRAIDRWKQQDLDAGTEPVTKQGVFLHPRRALVYRPYWLARVVTDRDEGWILLDGVFSTIAGRPDHAEVQDLLSQGIPDPLRSGEASYRKVHLAASRCPDCGFEQTVDHVLGVCVNCHRGLELRADGLRLVSYARGDWDNAPNLDGAYVPFWRYRFSVSVAGAALADLADYARALFAQAMPPGFKLAGGHLWIPAVRLLGTEPGDEAFKGLLEWIHATPPAVVSEKVPLGGHPAFYGVSVSEVDARDLGAFALWGLHTKPSAARLNTLLLKKAVVDAKLALAEPALVYVPFDRIGQDLVATGGRPRVPVKLITGSPEVDALRTTVHAARAAVGLK